MFCKHEWKELTTQVLPSGFQQLGPVSSLKNCNTSIFSITHIFIATCIKCNKIKKFVTRS